MSNPTIDDSKVSFSCSNVGRDRPADSLVRTIPWTTDPRRGTSVPPVSDSSMCAEHAEMYVRFASVTSVDGPTVYVHRLDDGVPVTYVRWAPGGQGLRWDVA